MEAGGALPHVPRGGAAPQTVSSMAQAEHLPIYKASYDLCLYLEQVVQGCRGPLWAPGSLAVSFTQSSSL